MKPEIEAVLLENMAALRQQVDMLTTAVQTMSQQNGQRLTRVELCKRFQVHRNTLAKRLIEPGFPKPDINGRWLLEEVLSWEMLRANR